MSGFLDRLPKQVTIVEVGPRDGLQNESREVPTTVKIEFINALTTAGLPVIEASSFVSPKAIPQLADAEAVMTQIERAPGRSYPVLVPNERGLERALAAGCDAFALFTAASEQFSQANVRASIDETFVRFNPVAEQVKQTGGWLRGYVSTAIDCPYAGHIAPEAAIAVAVRLFELGCNEVSLADTIGTGTPGDVARLLDTARARFDDAHFDHLALHFHDTYGMALVNVLVGLDYGIHIYDSSAGGLGGCPFALGAPGNLATEKLLRMLDGLGIETGVDRLLVDRAVSELRDAVPGIGEHG